MTAWADTSRAERAVVLDRMASALEAAGEGIIALADRETSLGSARLAGELRRTCYQLRFFGEVLRDGGYLEATIDHAGDTPMGPRPDLRRMLVPIGPVAVFAASNFPLAFSVPGGDTASALAAGCPVVIKAHSAHPGTSALCFEVLSGAAPAGVLSMVTGRQAGRDLLADPVIRAAGFTGSVGAGRELAAICAARPDPIPFFGELGSVNALVVTPAAAAERGTAIGQGLAGSFTLGAGQFCTKPGVAFVPAGVEGDAVRDACVAAVAGSSFTMLTPRILEGFLAGAAGVGADGRGPDGGAGAVVVEIDDVAGFLARPELLEEVFGPLLVIVRFADPEKLPEVLAGLPGALTASIQHGAGDPDLRALVAAVLGVAGRLVFNGFPTGVAVSWAQHHGGPWPATDTQHTSVGATAIRRWLRPVAFQDAPPDLLPAELRDGPVDVPRRVDGVLQLAS
ncbi:aldehyde dehydrogenase family protein [Nakamurella sp. YIM 132087]|uniref:Aldehyde dehydrogenase family protein n=1 Tax=Nakamurella alba TaxID=2665158 RepID=A0A7K1FGW5_9ACTN|nr:aldehyde dehydrogenase (NADP(+)) [Nakamurella alba]MTD13365.1 aldehyde dehydrogenase family protein [Nakamurella alba]